MLKQLESAEKNNCAYVFYAPESLSVWKIRPESTEVCSPKSSTLAGSRRWKWSTEPLAAYWRSYWRRANVSTFFWPWAAAHCFRAPCSKQTLFTAKWETMASKGIAESQLKDASFVWWHLGFSLGRHQEIAAAPWYHLSLAVSPHLVLQPSLNSFWFCLELQLQLFWVDEAVNFWTYLVLPVLSPKIAYWQPQVGI